MIEFEYLNKVELSEHAQEIFEILSSNMVKIAPTGNSLEEDYRHWFGCIGDSLQREERQIVLVKDKDNIVGYFQYSTNADTFFMEEIQLRAEYQGKGVFRALYGFVMENIKPELKLVDAYASTCNKKSISILEMLGLKNIGMNKNGRSYHFKGDFVDLVKWYEK